mmetsp:Transcript_60767/g.177551  ORF Transcript_60767/g.177551 Transcript_60767/m.177551 type:complete len:263 (+) Transcript_60767:2699-3487(+)
MPSCLPAPAKVPSMAHSLILSASWFSQPSRTKCLCRSLGSGNERTTASDCRSKGKSSNWKCNWIDARTWTWQARCPVSAHTTPPPSTVCLQLSAFCTRRAGSRSSFSFSSPSGSPSIISFAPSAIHAMEATNSHTKQPLVAFTLWICLILICKRTPSVSPASSGCDVRLLRCCSKLGVILLPHVESAEAELPPSRPQRTSRAMRALWRTQPVKSTSAACVLKAEAIPKVLGFIAISMVTEHRAIVRKNSASQASMIRSKIVA